MLACGALSLALAGYFWPWGHGPQAPERYRSEAVDQGEIVQSVAANGSLNPVTLVNVGTQISGTILRIHADFNQPVKAGDILAELDPALIRANLAELDANLSAARSAQALALSRLARSEALVARNFIAPSQLDDDRQAVEAARAQVRSAQARLAREHTNQSYGVVRSPIDGVVIARNVDVGQTVAASFQTPTLFQIAQDLTRMQIDTAVAEADVGLIRVGQAASFSVDAYPGQRFNATVRQIRLNPTIQQNVVTYNVVLATDNPEGVLLPGMTAQARIQVARKDEALRVPNAALRYRPAEAKGDTPGGKPPGRPGAAIYRLGTDGKPQRIAVTPGITDRSHTEILAGPLQPGDRVIVGDAPVPGQPTPPGNPGPLRMRLY